MVKGYKGFDKDLKCRNFQYEINKEYKQSGNVACCNNGFHFYENPLDVFNYYDPANSRYCEVDGSGDIDRDNDDSEIVCSKLKIGVEIGLSGLIKAGVKFILENVDWQNAKESNTGDRSVATNTGDRSVATNTGDRSVATNTGYRSAATNTGYRSVAIVEGKDSIAMASGIKGRAKGALGCWIVLAEWYQEDNYDWRIKQIKTAFVDGEIIKADTFYTLVNGDFVEYVDDEE